MLEIREREGRQALPRHEVPEGTCPYCQTEHACPCGGWREIFPNDPYDPEPLGRGDIHVKEWAGYFRVCNCNPDGERWPEALTVTLPFHHVPHEIFVGLYGEIGELT